MHLLTDEQLREHARVAAETAVREVLAKLDPLLPPYTQHALPPDARRKDFLAAVAAGCPHRKRGRVFEVSRADWAAWLAARAAPPLPIIASPEPPANDPRPPTRAPLDIDAMADDLLGRVRRR